MEPWRLLELWGAWVAHGRLPSALPRERSGGPCGTDVAFAAARYVESTEGFVKARPALRIRHVEGKDFKGVWLRRPGESENAAFLRLGWGEHLGLSQEAACLAVYEAFCEALAARLTQEPFIAPKAVESPDSVEIGEQASAELAQAVGGARPDRRRIRGYTRIRKAKR